MFSVYRKGLQDQSKDFLKIDSQKHKTLNINKMTQISDIQQFIQTDSDAS